MKSIKNITCCFFLLFTCLSTINAQLYKIDLDKKINKASLIVEGRIIDQHSFWNSDHSLIYTSNTLHVYKLFKGKITDTNVEVLTQGGSVGYKSLVVSDVIQFRKNETGMFFLYENAMKLRSPITKNILYDVYSSEQGFLKYSKDRKKAFAPFASYDNVEQTLYNAIKQRTGLSEKIIDATVTTSNDINGGEVSNGTAAVAITSFTPTTVHAGAINDEANNVLTINGSGFGDNPSGAAAVNFKDGNNDNVTPDFEVAYNSPYIISWTNTKIVLRVPDRAGTGKISVAASDGSSVESSTNLNVFFAVLDAQFNPTIGDPVIREPKLMNTNGSGGYTLQYSNSTAGKGIDFTTSPAKATFERALATWKEIAGANFTIGQATSLQGIHDDGINVVVFDNNNIGDDAKHMEDGVLESTYSWFSACTNGNNILTSQKTGFDILIRNDNVSLGSDITFEDGPCFPAQGTYDLEMIFLHEIGHALNLAHINDDYENDGNGYPTINPSKLMHYSILDYVDRRSPDASAYQGALYTITPQKNTYGNCGLFASEMSPLQSFAIANDECPSTFPSTQIANNTSVTIDLIHATSNKNVDPSFEQVNCKNTGTSVTNNAYYAFSTGTETKITLDIENYTTLPANLVSCSGFGTRLALYDVQSCPEGQKYPQPVSCATFTANGTINLSNLQQNHKYLLYFDGARNSKASFNIVFNSDSSVVPPVTTVGVLAGPNPVDGTGIVTVSLNNITGSSTYQYALYDVLGRRIATGNISIVQPTTTFKLQMKSAAAGVYFLRIVDANGNKISTTRILKP